MKDDINESSLATIPFNRIQRSSLIRALEARDGAVDLVDVAFAISQVSELVVLQNEVDASQERSLDHPYQGTRGQIGGSRLFLNLSHVMDVKIDALLLAGALLMKDGVILGTASVILKLAQLVQLLTPAEVDLLIVIKRVSIDDTVYSFARESDILDCYEEDRSRGKEILISAFNKGIIVPADTKAWRIIK